MKSINHNLKDKWILDSGATNHMTGNPELLDDTTCIVPLISVYLGSNDKLMATQISSFWREKWIDPKWNWRLHLRQRRGKIMLAPNSWKPIHSGARLAIKVPMPCHTFFKG
jgi:hypothetical protein